MSLFLKLFGVSKKCSIDSVAATLAQQIVIAGLHYITTLRKDLAPINGIAAGAEVCYFLLHHVDRGAHALLPPDTRNTLVDKVIEQVLCEYPQAVFTSPGGGACDTSHISKGMGEAFDHRQNVYAGCKRMCGGGVDLLELGTLYGVLGYYIMQARKEAICELDDAALMGQRTVDLDLQDKTNLFWEAVQLVPLITVAIEELDVKTRMSKIV